MFSLASGIYQSYFALPKVSILIVGIDGAGKTSLLERIKVTEVKKQGHPRSGGGGESARLPPPLHPALRAEGRLRLAAAAAAATSSACASESEADSRGDEGVEGGDPSYDADDERRTAIGERQADDERRATMTERQATRAGLDALPPPPFLDDCVPKGIVRTASSAGENSRRDGDSAAAPAHAPKDDAALPFTVSLAVEEDPGEDPSPSHWPAFSGRLWTYCPSPVRYSPGESLAQDGDEYHADGEAIAGGGDKNGGGGEYDRSDLSHLRYYAGIDYESDVEFDVKAAGGGRKERKKMLPLDRIRPTLGQNLARLDLGGCKCSLFDLSGAEKMRPLWERYYADADAVVYVIDASSPSANRVHESGRAFEALQQHEALRHRVEAEGLPMMVFANKLDVAYREYRKFGDVGATAANRSALERGISWTAGEEDKFVGGGRCGGKVEPGVDGSGEKNTNGALNNGDGGESSEEGRAVDFHDLISLYGFEPQFNAPTRDGGATGKHAVHPSAPPPNGRPHGIAAGGGENIRRCDNVFLFGGSARTGEGVRAAMEFLVASARVFRSTNRGGAVVVR